MDLTSTAQTLSTVDPATVSSLAMLGASSAGLGLSAPILSGLLDTFMDSVPDKLKPWIPAVAGLVIGCMNAKATGQGYAAGIMPGLIMAGLAAKHHDKRTDAPVAAPK